MNFADRTLIVSYSGSYFRNLTSNEHVLGSAILNEPLLDPIAQLESLLTIYLAVTNDTKKNDKLCLSYSDDPEEKRSCEDNCLTKPAKASNAGTKLNSSIFCVVKRITERTMLFC